MNKQEILEYNKLCAEFLGFKYKNQAKFWAKYPLNNNSFLSQKGYMRIDNLCFHSDWNWIITMLDKIALLDFGWKVTSKYVNIYSHTGDQRGGFDQVLHYIQLFTTYYLLK